MNISLAPSAPRSSTAAGSSEFASNSTGAEPAVEPSAELSAAPLPFRTVSYRRIKNLGNFENETVEASAWVMPSLTAEQTLAELRDWVHGQLDVSRTDLADLREAVYDLRQQRQALQDDLESIKAHIEATRTWAAQYGLPFVQDLGQTLPF